MSTEAHTKAHADQSTDFERKWTFWMIFRCKWRLFWDCVAGWFCVWMVRANDLGSRNGPRVTRDGFYFDWQRLFSTNRLQPLHVKRPKSNKPVVTPSHPITSISILVGTASFNCAESTSISSGNTHLAWQGFQKEKLWARMFLRVKAWELVGCFPFPQMAVEFSSCTASAFALFVMYAEIHSLDRRWPTKNRVVPLCFEQRLSGNSRSWLQGVQPPTFSYFSTKFLLFPTFWLLKAKFFPFSVIFLKFCNFSVILSLKFVIFLINFEDFGKFLFNFEKISIFWLMQYLRCIQLLRL